MSTSSNHDPAAHAGAIEPPAASVHPAIAAYMRHLEQEAGIHKVGSKTYFVTGYGANFSFIEGRDAVVMVNTGSFVELSAEAFAAFRTITQKPIAAIIYTHGYFDHTGGVRAFVPPGTEDGVKIYASAIWRNYVAQSVSPAQPEVTLRAASQMGFLLPQGDDGTIGAILFRQLPRLGSSSYLPPTDDISVRTTIEVAGIELELIPAPHDLDDGMIVWMPDEKILFTGDTLMPGAMIAPIATPRFEARRDPQAWTQSMGLAASFDASYLIPAYGSYLQGADEIKKRLVSQQQLAQHMIDECYRQIFSGATAQQIAERVTLPAELIKDVPFNELYHRFSWIIRSLISRDFGWFNGDALDYVRHGPSARAHRLASELGGTSELIARAQHAFEHGDFPWALELATEALVIEPGSALAKITRIAALKAIAYASDSSNERHYLLTTAGLETGVLDRAQILRSFRGAHPSETALLRPPSRLLDILGPKLARDRVGPEPLWARFQLTDRPDILDISVRDGVMLRGPDPYRDDPDMVLTLSYYAMISGVDGMTSFSELINAGEAKIEAGETAFDRFESMFDW